MTDFNRDSFIFYRSFAEALEELPAEIYKEVMIAIAKKALNNENIELNGISKTLFKLIKPQLEANNKKYKDGFKGGRPKKTLGFENDKEEYENKKPTDIKNKVIQKPNDNENDNDNENGKNIDKDNKNTINNNNIVKEKKGKISFSCLSFIESNEYKNVILEWLDYKQSRKENYKNIKSVEICYKQLFDASGGDASKARCMVERSIASGYKGIVFDDKKFGNIRNNFSPPNNNKPFNVHDLPY